MLPPRTPSAARSIQSPLDCWPEPVLPIVSVGGWLVVSETESEKLVVLEDDAVEDDWESVVDSSLLSNEVVEDSSVVEDDWESVLDSSLLSNEVVEDETSAPAQTWLMTRLPPSMSVLALVIVVSRSPVITT